MGFPIASLGYVDTKDLGSTVEHPMVATSRNKKNVNDANA